MPDLRVAIAGCGSVSESYLPNLQECPYADVVAVCDLVKARAHQRASDFDIPQVFSSFSDLLAEVEFDFFVNLTSMPAHYEVNKQALIAGKHVWSEKPFAPTFAKGQELVGLAQTAGVELLAAPNAVTSPQFWYMTEVLSDGKIGKVHAAHGCYGHGGPSWGPWFYGDGGGCMGDLAVYNITTLTGLLGPAKSVFALVGTAERKRHVEGQDIRVTADDNVMLLIDHGDAVFSHIQTGFVYGDHNFDRTVELIGTKGVMNLLGWDWGPHGVQIRFGDIGRMETHCEDPQGYVWQCGASQMAEFLVNGSPTLMTIEHALHVVEVLEAAYKAAEIGRNITVTSGFEWPLKGSYRVV